MATLADRAVGALFMALAALIFVYYSTWVLVTPFLDAAHPVQQLFPARELAIAIPAALGLVMIAGVGFFVSSVLAEKRRKKKAKSS